MKGRREFIFIPTPNFSLLEELVYGANSYGTGADLTVHEYNSSYEKIEHFKMQMHAIRILAIDVEIMDFNDVFKR
ncbi:hypothetical protein FF1_007771 [Malus domestica]